MVGMVVVTAIGAEGAGVPVGIKGLVGPSPSASSRAYIEQKCGFIVDINAYDEWQAKKNASSAAMAEFGKANAAYLKATRRARSGRDRASDTGQSVAVTK